MSGELAPSVEEATEIALKTVIDYLNKHNEIEFVRFVFFGKSNYDIYAQVFTSMSS